jgi:hypothetical protein
MKLYFFSFLFLFLTFVAPSVVFAHPGNTAADGCHYCRTNCEKWGVPANERHCHGGGSAAPETVKESVSVPVYVAPTKVLPKPTRKPTVIKNTPTPIPGCSATSDNYCPKKCTAGNDADCCAKISTMKWYENWGCYPKQHCSAEKDDICHSSCTAGNDADCCVQKTNMTWYNNWGCYPKQ